MKLHEIMKLTLNHPVFRVDSTMNDWCPIRKRQRESVVTSLALLRLLQHRPQDQASLIAPFIKNLPAMRETWV